MQRQHPFPPGLAEPVGCTLPLAGPVASRALQGAHTDLFTRLQSAGLLHPSNDWQALAPPAPSQHMCELLVVSPPRPLLTESSSGK